MLTDERIATLWRTTVVHCATNIPIPPSVMAFARAILAESQPVAESRVAQLQADELLNRLERPYAFTFSIHETCKLAALEIRRLRSATPKEPT